MADVNDVEVTRSSDPRLVASRIFIGNLPTDKCSQSEVKDYFQKYGVVLGVSLFKGFGFVQFRELEDAQAAVNIEHGRAFKGSKMDIRLASEGRKKREPLDSRPLPARGAEPPIQMQRRPLTPEAYRQPAHLPGAYDRHGQPLDPYYIRPSPVHHQHPADVVASLHDPVIAQHYVAPPVVSRLPVTHVPAPQSFSHVSGIRPTAPVPVVQPAVAVVQQPQAQQEVTAPPVKRTDIGVERPFDCAILVADKAHRSYAEMVERRLLELNLSVDLLYLIQQDALPKLVETFSHKGLLFLIIIQKQHEEHKSVTVNILHGSPQEHRNMPLEDALLMLSRDFNGYLSKLRCGSEQPSLNFLLHLISDGKNLSQGELDRVIQHLTDRKNQLGGTSGESFQQQQPTGGAAAVAKSDSKESSAADLQKKIMSILGGGSTVNSGSNVNSNMLEKPLTPSSTSSEPPPAKILALATSRPGVGLMGAAPSGADAGNVSQASNALGSIDIHKTLNSLLQNPDALKNILPKHEQQNISGAGYQSMSSPAQVMTHPSNSYDSRSGSAANPTMSQHMGALYGNGIFSTATSEAHVPLTVPGFMGGSYQPLMTSSTQSRGGQGDNLGMSPVQRSQGSARGLGGRGLLDNPLGQ